MAYLARCGPHARVRVSDVCACTCVVIEIEHEHKHSTADRFSFLCIFINYFDMAQLPAQFIVAADRFCVFLVAFLRACSSAHVRPSRSL